MLHKYVDGQNSFLWFLIACRQKVSPSASVVLIPLQIRDTVMRKTALKWENCMIRWDLMRDDTGFHFLKHKVWWMKYLYFTDSRYTVYPKLSVSIRSQRYIFLLGISKWKILSVLVEQPILWGIYAAVSQLQKLLSTSVMQSKRHKDLFWRLERWLSS